MQPKPGGRKVAKVGKARVAGFPEKKLLYMIRATGILGEPFLENENKLDS